MADIKLEDIKKLRARTGAGINYVKEALTSSNGDMEKAVLYLREKGLAKASKRSGNATNHGFIASYIHGSNMGVLVELQCETDFAAKSEKFKELGKELAMHIAAMSPDYIDVDSVPAEILDTEKQLFVKDVEGKPENVQEKIIAGKLEKFYEEVVLLKQKYVRDEEKSVEDLINDYVAAIGESIKVASFAKLQLGLKPEVSTVNEE